MIFKQTPRSSAKRLNLIVIGMDSLGSGRTDTRQFVPNNMDGLRTDTGKDHAHQQGRQVRLL